MCCYMARKQLVAFQSGSSDDHAATISPFSFLLVNRFLPANKSFIQLLHRCSADSFAVSGQNAHSFRIRHYLTLSPVPFAARIQPRGAANPATANRNVRRNSDFDGATTAKTSRGGRPGGRAEHGKGILGGGPHPRSESNAQPVFWI
jgi:hypothetical protein